MRAGGGSRSRSGDPRQRLFTRSPRRGARIISIAGQAQGKERPVEHPSFYRTTQIDQLSIFYRETGPKDPRTLLLLAGLPPLSRLFEPPLARPPHPSPLPPP